MATSYTWNGSASSLWNNGANWTPNGIPGAVAGDDVTFDSTAVNCTLNINPVEPLVGLIMTGGYSGTLDFSGNTLDVDGDATVVGSIADAGSGGVLECNGNFSTTAALPVGFTVDCNVTVGTKTLTANVATNRASLIYSGSGRVDLATDNYWADLDYTGSDQLVMAAGKDLYLIGSDGSSTDAHFIHPGTGTISTSSAAVYMNDGGNVAHKSNNGAFDLVVAAGKTATLITNTLQIFRTITLGENATITDKGVYFVNPVAGSFVVPASATFASELRINCTTWTPNQDITLADKEIELNRGTFDFANGLDLGTGLLNLDASGGGIATVNMNGGDLTCGDIRLGWPAKTHKPTLLLGSGDHNVSGGIVIMTNAGASTPTLDVGTGTLTLGGTLDGAAQGSSQTLTVVGAAIGGGHAEVIGGTIADVTIPDDDATLDATRGVTDGKNNRNVWFSGCSGGHTVVNSGCGVLGSGKAA